MFDKFKIKCNIFSHSFFDISRINKINLEAGMFQISMMWVRASCLAPPIGQLAFERQSLAPGSVVASELGVLEVFWLDDSGVVAACSWISCVFVV